MSVADNFNTLDNWLDTTFSYTELDKLHGFTFRIFKIFSFKLKSNKIKEVTKLSLEKVHHRDRLARHDRDHVTDITGSLIYHFH